MKPILFPATATSFTSKGLGTITDAISCYVTEARNGIFDLEMQIPVDSKRYKDIALDKIILAKPNPYDNPQPFRIHKITRPIHGIVTILANHLSYDLKGMPVNAFTATSCSDAVSKLKSSSLITCPFTFTTNIVSSTIMTVARPYTIRDLMGGVEGSLIDTYGGEYKFDKYSVQLLSSRGQNRGVKIKYGINLIDLTQEENCSSVYSGVLPYYASEKGIVVGDVQRASGTYPVDRILPLDLTQYFTRDYDEADTLPTVAQLNTRGAAYVLSNSIGVPKVSLSLSFAQLPRKDVYLCDTVTVEFEKMGIETTAKVIETIYDVLEGRYRSVKIGDPRANIVNSIADEASARQASGVRMQSYLEKSDSAIRAKVSKIGGSNTSFGWEMNDTSHTWYANEEEVMKANASGLEIKGKVTAKSGYIGNGSSGFTIGNTAIYNGLSSLAGVTNGIYLGTDGMALGGGKFKVTAAGALKATDADITGKITSSSGEIGGFTIGNSSLYNGMESLTDTQHNGVYVGTNGIALGKGAFKVTSAGAVTASNLELKGGSIKLGGTENNPVFHVTSAGAVTASNLTLTGGSITIKDDNNNVIFSASRSGVMVNGNGTFTGNVYAKNIQYSASNSNIGTFSGQGITDLSILAGKLQNETLTTAQMASGVRSSLGYANFSHDVFNNADTAPHISCSLLTVRGGPVIVSGRVSASYLVGVHKVLSGDNEYDMSIHTHQISESNGVVTIGAADWTGGSHSFNIADTQFFQDAVSAVTVKSYGFEQDEDQETDYTKLYIVLGLNGETTNTVGNIDISGSYNAGIAKAQPRSIVRRTNLATGQPMPDTWNSSTNKGYVYLRATTRDDGIYYDANIEVDTNSAIYQAGGNSTTITAITRTYPDGETSYPYYDSPTLGKVIEFKAQASMSNGQGDSRTLTVPADAAYNAGHTAGVATVYVTAMQYYTVSGEQTISYDPTNKTLSASVQATLTNGNTNGSIRTVTIPATLAYDAGYADGEAAGAGSGESSVTVTSLGLDPNDTVSYSETVNNYYIPIKAVLSNNRDRTTTITISGQEAYNAGSSAGAASVTVTTISRKQADTYNAQSHNTFVYVQAEASNGAIKDNIIFTVSGANAYNAGVTDGASGVTITAITRTYPDGESSYPYYDSPTLGKVIEFKVMASMSNGQGDNATLTVPATAAYNAGYNAGDTAGQATGAASVTITAITRTYPDGESSYPYYDSPTLGKVIEFKAAATMSNGQGGSTTLTVPADAAYNAGYAAGSEGGSGSVTVTSLGLDPNEQVSYSATVNNYYVPIKTVLSNGATRSTTVTVSGQEAYAAGVNSVTITTITRTYPDGESSYPYYDSPTLGKVIELKAQASMSNGQSTSQTLTVPATAAYNAGYTAGQTSGSANVTITSVGRDTSQNTTYDSDTKIYTIPVLATASNGATNTGTIQQSGIAAYNAGKTDAEDGVTIETTASQTEWNASTHKKTVTVTINAKNSDNTVIETSTQLIQVDASSEYAAGAAGVSVTAMQYYTVSGEDTITYDSANNTLSASVQATLSNGNTSGSIRTVTFPANLAYNAGVQSVTVTDMRLNTDWATSNTGFIYQSAYNQPYGRYAMRVKASLSNGRAWSYTLYHNADDAYNAGASAGSAGVTASATGMTTSSSDYGTYDQAIGLGASSLYTVSGTQYGRIKVTLSNGTERVVRIGMPAGSGGSVSSITVSRDHDPRNASTTRECMDDWDLSDNTNAFIKVKLQAYSGSTAIGSVYDGKVCVNDIADFFASDHATVLATQTSTANNNYAFEVDTTGYTNAFYKSGNYQYVRFRLQNSENDDLDIVRVKMAATDTAISEVLGLASNSSTYTTYNKQVSFASSSVYTPSGSSTQYVRVQVNLNNGTNQVIRVAIPVQSGASGQITIDRQATSSSVNPYYGTLPYYAYISNKHYVYVKATCNGATDRSQYIDINDIVDKAYSNGYAEGAGSGSVPGGQVRMRCYSIQPDESGYYAYYFYCILQGSSRFSTNTEYNFYY